MGSNYRNIPTKELYSMWNRKRLSLKIGADPSVFRDELAELRAMRDELDRRDDGRGRIRDVDFEKYVTD